MTTIIIEDDSVSTIMVQPGPPGPSGPAGQGVPTGGTTGQVLAKASSTSYDTAWINLVGGLSYQGAWNASTNSPALTSSVGTNGYYYIVSVAGSTNLNGITDWKIGDWAIFNGTVWQKIDNSDLVSSVNGQTGTVVLTAADVGAEPTITTLPVANGGFGQSMTMQTSTLTGTQGAFPAGLIRWNGASTLNIAGIAAPSESTFCYVYNITAATSAQFLNESGSASSTANRIQTITSASQVLNPRQAACLFYDTTASLPRWRLMWINSITSATSPLLLSSAGVLSIQASSASQSGSVSSAQVNSWDNKIGGTIAANTILYGTGASTASADTEFSWNPTNKQMGVQVNANDSQAALHIKSLESITLTDISVAAANLIQFDQPVAPNSVNYTPVTPDIQKPQGTASPSNLGSGGYTGSDIVDYEMRPGYDDGAGNIYWGVSTQQILGISDASNFDIDFDWAATVPTQNFTVNIWSVSRQVNSGGYNDYQRFTASTGTDNNSGWNSGADTFSVSANDFLANSTSYNNNYYGTKDSPISTVIVSGAYASAYTDAGSGDAYKLQIDITGGDSEAGYNVDWNGTGHLNGATGSFTVGPQSFTNGSPTTTPSSYGYQSDGSTLNRSYDFYTYQASPLLYATNAYNVTTSDPNNSLWYYIELTFTSTTGSVKILRNGTDSKITSTTILDDGVTNFGDGATVTPNSIIPPALFAEGDAILGDTSSSKLGFFGGSGTTKPTITGSRGGNAALASLLTALDNMDLITDSTTA